MGRHVVMNEDAIANYGERWRGVVLEVTHSATRHMPAKEFYSRGEPDGYHPGFDGSSGSPLHDLRRIDTGERLDISLYDWELAAAPKAVSAPEGEPEDQAGPRF